MKPDNYLKALYTVFIGLLILTIFAVWAIFEALKAVLV